MQKRKKIIHLKTLVIVLPFQMVTLARGQNIFIKNDNVRFENSNLTENEIKTYLDNNENLDPIEGIWSFSAETVINGASSRQDNYAKVAIIKDIITEERDYIEIVLSVPEELYPLTGYYKNCIIGEAEKTAYPNVFLYYSYKQKTEVINQPKNITLTIDEKGLLRVYNAKILTTDKINDIALLSIDDKDFKPFSTIPYILTNKAEIGESVFTIGFPLNNIMGNNFKVTNGIISSNSGIHDDVRFYQITVPIQPGNSGGPLFNEYGDIIGLTTSRLSGESIGTKIENANYAIKSNYLLFLTELAGIRDDLPKMNQLGSKELKDQVEILKDYVCLIRVEK